MILTQREFEARYPETYKQVPFLQYVSPVYGEVSDRDIPFVCYGREATPSMLLRWKGEWLDVSKDARGEAHSILLDSPAGGVVTQEILCALYRMASAAFA